MKIAIIPARAGSKRLPDKNIKNFAGKPLIAWTIEAAAASNCFDEIIVSTDSSNIAKIARTYGANVPYIRSQELASDTATTEDVITDIVEHLETLKLSITSITILQPTSPLRNSDHIQGAFSLFESKLADSVISVTEVDHPVQYCNTLDKNTLSLNEFIKQNAMKRSQDLEANFRLNGAIYIINRHLIGKFSQLYNEHSYAYIMNKECSVDIDDELDFFVAESIFMRKVISND